MNDHSVQMQAQRLRNEELLKGWGAALAIGRKALNLTLQDNFLEGLGSLTYLEPFTETFSINEGNSQLIQIEGLVLGATQVSFERSVSTDRLVTLRMSLLAADYRYLLHLPGEPQRFHRSLSVRESMDFTLEARGRLSVHTDLVSRQIQVLLDVGQATDFSCNLGETAYERAKIGERLQQWLAKQPDERRVLRLATIDLRDYRPMTSKSVMAITQPAPWAGEQGREGDGALVLFMQLGVDFEPGGLPGARYPYLLSKDDDVDAALVVQKDLQELALGTPEQVLESLSQGSKRKIRLLASAEQLSFGTLQAGPLTREIAPAVTTLVAAEQCQFKMSGGSGAVAWDARNLFRPLATGQMTTGLYSTRERQDFAKSTQLVLVTAHAQNDPQSHTASALVVEYDQPLVIAPQTAVWSLDNPPIEFVAAGGSVITWSLEGEKLGTLTTAGNRATFTPDKPSGQVAPVQLQRVRVHYNDKGRAQDTEACVIIVNRPASLDIEPAFVARHQTFGQVQFRVPEDWRQALLDIGQEPPQHLQRSDYAWEVVGDGEISADGLYTPPGVAQSSVSVVRLVLLGRVSGYAVIEHGQRTGMRSLAVTDWNDLDHFYVKAITAPQCYANGMQQIQVQVDIQTRDPGDGSHAPISDDELQSLKFYTVNGSELPVVEVGIEPPAAGTPGTWVMNRAHNPLLEMRPGQGSPAPARALPGQTIANYWLQTTSTVPVEVYAMFKQSGLGGRWFNSEVVSQQNGKVALQGMTLPTFDASRDYPWDEQDKRVRQEGKVVGNDTFGYMTLTVDYWKLTHVTSEGRRIPFVAIDVEPNDNKSVMRWASDEYEDVQCSYSGFMIGGESDQMIYDGALVRMAGKRGLTLEALDPNRRPATGELLLSLNRVNDFRQRFEQPDDPDILTDEEEAEREHLLRAFRFRLLDQQGNRHDLQVTYAGVGREGRNSFFLSKPPARH
jgi:hypothetical protein